MNLKIFYNVLVVFNFIKIISTNDTNVNRHHRSSINRSSYSNEGNCQKIYDHLRTITNSNDQEIRQMEAIESRLIQMETATQERLDTINNDLQKISTQTGDRDETNFGYLRRQTETGRQTLDNSQLRTPQIRSDYDAGQAAYEGNEHFTNITQMLSAIGIFLSSVREGVFNVQQDVQNLQKNVTTLLQFSRELQKKQHTQPNKQYINHAINNIRSQLCSNTQYGLTSLNGKSSSVSSSGLPSSCTNEQIKENQINKIEINSLEPFYVKCFSNDDYGRGWTVILNRLDGSINFYRPWSEYKLGFGNIAGEFFIGLDKLHAITSTRLHELIVLLQDFKGEARFARYGTFAIAGEKENYALNVIGDYGGTAGDSLHYSASYKFSTYDNDNDGWVEGNCAQAHTGAWWYNACEKSNLMGQYLKGDVEEEHLYQGMYWSAFKGANYSLYAVRMMIRPLDYLNDDE